MGEKKSFFAMIHLPDGNVLIEKPTFDELKEGILRVWEKPKIKHPFYHFESEVVAVEGERIEIDFSRPQDAESISENSSE